MPQAHLPIRRNMEHPVRPVTRKHPRKAVTGNRSISWPRAAQRYRCPVRVPTLADTIRRRGACEPSKRSPSRSIGGSHPSQANDFLARPRGAAKYPSQANDLPLPPRGAAKYLSQAKLSPRATSISGGSHVVGAVRCGSAGASGGSGWRRARYRAIGPANGGGAKDICVSPCGAGPARRAVVGSSGQAATSVAGPVGGRRPRAPAVSAHHRKSLCEATTLRLLDFLLAGRV